MSLRVYNFAQCVYKCVWIYICTKSINLLFSLALWSLAAPIHIVSNPYYHHYMHSRLHTPFHI